MSLLPKRSTATNDLSMLTGLGLANPHGAVCWLAVYDDCEYFLTRYFVAPRSRVEGLLRYFNLEDMKSGGLDLTEGVRPAGTDVPPINRLLDVHAAKIRIDPLTVAGRWVVREGPLGDLELLLHDPDRPYSEEDNIGALAMPWLRFLLAGQYAGPHIHFRATNLDHWRMQPIHVYEMIGGDRNAPIESMTWLGMVMPVRLA